MGIGALSGQCDMAELNQSASKVPHAFGRKLLHNNRRVIIMVKLGCNPSPQWIESGGRGVPG